MPIHVRLDPPRGSEDNGTDDGRVVWTRDISSASGLAAAGDTVVTVDGSDVIQAVRPTGDGLWKQDGFVRRGLTAPVIAGQRVLFGDRFGNCTVVSRDDDRLKAAADPRRGGKALTW